MTARACLAPLRWLLLVLAFACLAMPARAGVYTVVADRDSFIKEDKPNENHDTEADLDISAKAGPTNRHWGLMGFTMPAIPSNEYVVSAQLQLYVSLADNVPVEFHRITAAWTESGVTWTNFAGAYDATVLATVIPTPVNSTVSVDLTSLVEGWRAGTYADNGFIITTNQVTTAKFKSHDDGTPARRPQLVITTARIIPALTVVKSSSIVSDPQNGATNPKAIPGALMNYTVTVTNTNAGTADAASTTITDAVPSNMRLYVGDVGGVGSGPVAFTNGATTSGLGYSFTSLASITDGIAFSNNGGATWTYTPVPDANGYDSNVTNFRISPTGTFNGAASGNTPSFQLQLRMQVR
jgi:uncharacterized repeat protein (TIGR01451 family)